MLVVETIAKIRRAFFVQGKAIKAICRDLGVSRKVVRKIIRSGSTEFRYEREDQPLPKIGRWRDTLDELLLANEAKASRERHNCRRRLAGIGFQPHDEFVQLLCRHRFLCTKNKWSRDQQRDRYKIVQNVVWKRVKSSVQHMRGCGADGNCVAIGARAARPVPMFPSAPPTFSMRMGCASDFLIGSTRIRAAASVGLPAGYVSIIVMGRDG